jgi:GTPase SAR1 family protein
MGGQARLNQLLGVNEFAEALFPTLTRYFTGTSDETPDDVIDDAYVSTDELGRYEGVLEAYLKDRPAKLAGNQIREIATTRTSASGISDELRKFTTNPTFYSHVQLIVGAVGAGKSTFIRRYYRKLRSKEVIEHTRWAFVNFNVMPPGGAEALRDWIAERFVRSFADVNQIDVFDLKQIERIFAVELNQFEKGPSKLLKNADPAEFARRRATLLESLLKDFPRFAQSIARHYSSEKGLGIVIVFDNVDKRSRDQQLVVFEAAQWLKDITRALVLINLRDTTFEAHRDEPPLDAFANAINFYIRPPRFAQVIRKRLELVLAELAADVDKKLEYSLESGIRVKYPATRLGEFLMGVYASLFDRHTTHVASALEALVAKDVRRALGIFGDIIVSPHVPTRQITGAGLTAGEYVIQENRIIRALMRGRYKYYTGKSAYMRNVLRADPDHSRPSNLLNAYILEYLIRNRKEKVDFAQEGYATIGTIVKKVSQLGYDEEDIFKLSIRWWDGAL